MEAEHFSQRNATVEKKQCRCPARACVLPHAPLPSANFLPPTLLLAPCVFVYALFFMHARTTTPDSSALDTRARRAASPEKTASARPYSVSLARAGGGGGRWVREWGWGEGYAEGTGRGGGGGGGVR